MPSKRRKRSRKKPLELIEGEGCRKSGAVMGVNVHKDVLAWCIASETRNLEEGECPNTQQGIATLIKKIKQWQVQSVGMEATAQYHFKLMSALLDAGVPELVANAKQTKDTQGKKTDKFDARRIAITHRDGRLKPSVIAPREILELRRATRGLLRLIEEQTKCKQRINQFLHHYDCTLPQQVRGFLRNQWSLKLLQACLTQPSDANPDKTMSVSISELVVAHYSRPSGKWTSDDRRKIAVLTESLTRLCQQLTPMDALALRTEILQVRIWMQLQEQQRLVYLMLAQQNPDFRAQMQLLLSVPGIGPDTAAIILAEVVDIHYFSSPKSLAKWAGLAPRTLQSGKRKRITGRLHKGGNRYLRRALTLACTNIYARGDATHPIRQFIKNLYDGKKPYWLAICVGARKLLTILWYLLKNDQSWQPPTLTTVERLEALQQKVTAKLTLFDRKIRRYRTIQEKINRVVDDQLDQIPSLSQDPKELLRLLVEAV